MLSLKLNTVFFCSREWEVSLATWAYGWIMNLVKVTVRLSRRVQHMAVLSYQRDQNLSWRE